MLTEPNSMEDLVYFTRRKIGDKEQGFVMAWVYRKICPKCGKAKMGKPVEKGKVKIRATEYVCPNCSYSENKKQHEESLKLEAKYTCPFCLKEGEATAEYKKKMVDGVPAYVIVCQHCGKKIAITKKMKEGKKKEEDFDED